jgi:serine/threonine protein kinase
MFRGDSNIH